MPAVWDRIPFGQLGRAAARHSEHDIRLALEAWVEKGAAPDKIIAAKLPNANEADSGASLVRCTQGMAASMNYGGGRRSRYLYPAVRRLRKLNNLGCIWL